MMAKNSCFLVNVFMVNFHVKYFRGRRLFDVVISSPWCIVSNLRKLGIESTHLQNRSLPRKHPQFHPRQQTFKIIQVLFVLWSFMSILPWYIEKEHLHVGPRCLQVQMLREIADSWQYLTTKDIIWHRYWIHMDPLFDKYVHITTMCTHTHDIPPRYPSKIHITTSSRHAGPRDYRSLGGSADELCFVGSCHGCHAERWHLGCGFCGNECSMENPGILGNPYGISRE